ncbi:MAG: GNAT family N-acetyltransferase [Dermatophilus congolensis]|nr:GNAT family N-acetyltransferase [Dermatophilus congolensis]
MSETSIRVLGENEWEAYRDARLSALKESPEAFAATYESEVDFDEELWRERMNRSSRLVAEQDNNVVGIVSVRGDDDMFEDAAEVFGLWVPLSLRGSGVAAKLVQAAARLATNRGHGQLIYWVGTENARAVAFASSYGFRPSEFRRPMDRQDDESVEEIALTLALDR